MQNILYSKKAKEILNLLLKGDKSLPEITDHLGISKPATLKNLDEMERMNMIRSEMITTKVGRIKMFKIRAYSLLFSMDPQKGVMFYQNNAAVNLNNPLVGQVEQDEFRNAVKIYMKNMTMKLKKDFKAVLYGSIARGEGTSKSDIDILLLSKKEWNKKEKETIMDALHEGSIETQIQVKPLFWTIDNFLQKSDNLTERIKNEGMILYDSIEDEKVWRAMKRYWNIKD
jgi:predicted nucleotidyltransferase